MTISYEKETELDLEIDCEELAGIQFLICLGLVRSPQDPERGMSK